MAWGSLSTALVLRIARPGSLFLEGDKASLGCLEIPSVSLLDAICLQLWSCAGHLLSDQRSNLRTQKGRLAWLAFLRLSGLELWRRCRASVRIGFCEAAILTDYVTDS